MSHQDWKSNNWTVTFWDTEMTFSAACTSERSTHKYVSRYSKSDGHFWLFRFFFLSLPFLKSVLLQNVKVNPGCCWEGLMSSLIPHFHDFLWAELAFLGHGWARGGHGASSPRQWELLLVSAGQGQGRRWAGSYLVLSSSLHSDLKSLWNISGADVTQS